MFYLSKIWATIYKLLSVNDRDHSRLFFHITPL
jgi:hypothetical protein